MVETLKNSDLSEQGNLVSRLNCFSANVNTVKLLNLSRPVSQTKLKTSRNNVSWYRRFYRILVESFSLFLLESFRFYVLFFSEKFGG